MYKKTIKYTDYNDIEREEDFYFNLSKAELMDMELSTSGGFTNYVRRIIASDDTPTLIRIFKELLLKSYGEKSLDGKRFIKSEELSKAFSETEAYSEFYMELATNAQSASDFVNKIIPKNLDGDLEAESKKFMEGPKPASLSNSLDNE